MCDRCGRNEATWKQSNGNRHCDECKQFVIKMSKESHREPPIYTRQLKRFET